MSISRSSMPPSSSRTRSSRSTKATSWNPSFEQVFQRMTSAQSLCGSSSGAKTPASIVISPARNSRCGDARSEATAEIPIPNETSSSASSMASISCATPEPGSLRDLFTSDTDVANDPQPDDVRLECALLIARNKVTRRHIRRSSAGPSTTRSLLLINSRHAFNAPDAGSPGSAATDSSPPRRCSLVRKRSRQVRRGLGSAAHPWIWLGCSVTDRVWRPGRQPPALGPVPTGGGWAPHQLRLRPRCFAGKACCWRCPLQRRVGRRDQGSRDCRARSGGAIPVPLPTHRRSRTATSRSHEHSEAALVLLSYGSHRD
jgi:hypothetical protein